MWIRGELPFERLQCAWKRHAADGHVLDSVSFVFGTRKAPSRNAGQNFVARRSAQRHRDEDKIQAWKRDNPGAALHGGVLVALYDSRACSSFPPANCTVTCLDLCAGILLESASVSSPHAIICECLPFCAHHGTPKYYAASCTMVSAAVRPGNMCHLAGSLPCRHTQWMLLTASMPPSRCFQPHNATALTGMNHYSSDFYCCLLYRSGGQRGLLFRQGPRQQKQGKLSKDPAQSLMTDLALKEYTAHAHLYRSTLSLDRVPWSPYAFCSFLRHSEPFLQELHSL